MCKKADSVNRSGTGLCWDCICWLVWGYRVSCWAAIVIKDRLHGIDLYTEKRRVCTSRPGLVGDPMTPCDIIPVYTKMNENFKGGLNNVMPRNNDPVDSRYHQRCVDNRHWSWTRASVCETGRRKDAAVSRILMGRDSRSVRFLVPDTRGVDRSYHDVTVVDMEDKREQMVVLADMTRLRELWPPEVFNHMKWFQQDLEMMRKSAKKEYSQTRPMPCKFCGKVIWVDMYRHVARLHLDLVQLWRCPIAWWTTWKGSPQDCLDIYGMAMMLRGYQRRPALRSTHRRGLCVESCGRIRYEWNIPVSPRTSCYLANSGCR